MQSFFWHVLSDRRIKATLMKEVSDAAANGTIPAVGNIAWNEAQALPYFQACLKEAMRVRPAVGLNITRYVPPGGVEIEGEFFPGGTRLAANGWVLHRDAKIFGQDADIFRPERWLVDEDEAKRMDRYMFQVSPCFQTPAPLLTVRAYWRLTIYDSSVVAPICASEETLPCLRLTRSYHAFCETTR